MQQALTLEAEITADGQLHVELPADAPRGRVVLSLARADASTEALFDELAAQWRQATEFVSSLTEMVAHPAYQRIIGLGALAIPRLLAELRREPDHWFWALKAITGEDPVRVEDRGKIEAMRDAWLDWGRRGGYC